YRRGRQVPYVDQRPHRVLARLHELFDEVPGGHLQEPDQVRGGENTRRARPQEADGHSLGNLQILFVIHSQRDEHVTILTVPVPAVPVTFCGSLCIVACDTVVESSWQ